MKKAVTGGLSSRRPLEEKIGGFRAYRDFEPRSRLFKRPLAQAVSATAVVADGYALSGPFFGNVPPNGYLSSFIPVSMHLSVAISCAKNVQYAS